MPVSENFGAIVPAASLSMPKAGLAAVSADLVLQTTPLPESEAQHVADLSGMRRLYELQAKLAEQTDVKVAFHDVLALACEFTGTDRGCVQFLSPDGHRLEMFVWQGYPDESPFINFFRYEGLEAGCEVARVQRKRLIIEDTVGFEGLDGTEGGAAAAADGIRASQSTPMTSRANETIGVISTQFRQPHRPSNHELQLMDMLAWTAAEFLERHRAEVARREAQALLQKAFAIDTVGMLYFSLDGGMSQANEAFVRLSGYRQEELLALQWEALTAPEFWAMTESHAKELATRGETPPYEKQFVRPDGTRWWGLCAPTRLRGEGPTAEYMEFIVDITERKQAEAQLIRTNQDLNNFIYIASHDLKQPIANIEGLLTALREQLPAEAHQAPLVPRMLDMMQDSVERFQHTIAQLTHLTRLQQAHNAPSEPVDLAAAIQGVCLDLAVELREVQLTVDITPGLSVHLPPQNLRSVVYNLLSNGVKYRCPDRPSIVHLCAYQTGHAAMLQVQDNGLGLDAVQQGQLFGLFKRLHTHVEGTGIGLYTVKRLVENAGGSIAVQSQAGVGSTFTVTFPA